MRDRFLTLNLILILLMAIIYWVNRDGFNKKINVVDSLYFSTVTQTTLGYGDVYPEKTSTKLLVVFHIITSLYFNVFEMINAEDTRLLNNF